MGRGFHQGAEWGRKHPAGSAIVGILFSLFLLYIFVSSRMMIGVILIGLYLVYCIYCLVKSLK